MSPEARERFYRSLFGESAADMIQMWRTGRVPDGRGADFAGGGCVGEANAAIPSVWTLKRELEDELEAVRQAVAVSGELVATGDAFAACAQRVGDITARGPADVERIASSDPSASAAATAVMKGCMQVWATGYRKAEVAALKGFEQRNAGALSLAGIHRRTE